jgi:acyl dehydratase
MDYMKELAKYLRTKKQKEFFEEYKKGDFLKNADKYEAWDEVEFGREVMCPITFEVTLEDLVQYAEGSLDTNPLFVDEAYAKKSIWGKIIPHPILATVMEFFCLRGGVGDWIRTPGSRNPGMRYEFYEPFEVGDVIRLKMKPYDRWIKRQKYYLTYQIDFINQNDKLRMRHWCTLILPKTRADLVRFMKGEHALEA